MVIRFITFIILVLTNVAAAVDRATAAYASTTVAALLVVVILIRQVARSRDSLSNPITAQHTHTKINPFYKWLTWNVGEYQIASAAFCEPNTDGCTASTYKSEVY